jgi:hypothetical protein
VELNIKVIPHTGSVSTYIPVARKLSIRPVLLVLGATAHASASGNALT